MSAFGEGSIIEMSVDLSKWTITWNVNRQQVASASIPSVMRGQPIFIQLSLANLDSAAELII